MSYQESVSEIKAQWQGFKSVCVSRGHVSAQHRNNFSGILCDIFFTNSCLHIQSLTISADVIPQTAPLMLCHYLLLSLLDSMPGPADNTSMSLALICRYWPYLSMSSKYSVLRSLSNFVSFPPDCFFKRKSMFLAALQEQRSHSNREKSEWGKRGVSQMCLGYDCYDTQTPGQSVWIFEPSAFASF